MTYGIQDFSRTDYQYTGDDGNTWLVTERTAVHAAVAAAASAAALAAKDGTEKGYFRGKPRHMWFKATTEIGTAPKTYYPRRKIIFNNANRADLLGATLSLDGLTFTPTGRVEGERNHK